MAARGEIGLDELGEIERLAPVFLDAAARVAAAIPGLRVLVPAANAACREALAALVRGDQSRKLIYVGVQDLYQGEILYCLWLLYFILLKNIETGN